MITVELEHHIISNLFIDSEARILSVWYETDQNAARTVIKNEPEGTNDQCSSFSVKRVDDDLINEFWIHHLMQLNLDISS